jgi:hypothetical protein
MTKRHLKDFLCIWLMLAGPIVGIKASEPLRSASLDEEQTASAPRQGASPQVPATAPTTDDPAPNPAVLNQPKLGTALENFKPSEAISADNAVPFPVNI